MPSKNPEVLKKASQKHWEKIKNDPEVKRKARERAKKWAEENKEKVKAYREANKEKLKQMKKEWVEKNREHVNRYKVENQKKHMDSLKIRMKRYHQTEGGRSVRNNIRNAYRKRMKDQSLRMFDKQNVFEVYKKCRELKKTTGTSYEVDHITPLRGELVSGLHVSWNLRIIPMKENREKSNKFDQEENIN